MTPEKAPEPGPETPRPVDERNIFRTEALEHRDRAQREGGLVRLSPSWTGWVYWLVLATAGAALLYSALGTVNEYATGPAIIRVRARQELTAPASGVVSAVPVSSGTRVEAGQVLVLLHNAAEQAELERLEHEFELQLLHWMRNPADETARQALMGLRAQKELARARLAERSLRAPRAGVVSDVRVRVGQQLSPGEVVLTWVGEDEGLLVTALLPGQSRPFLRPGGRLRLELDGFRYEYRELVIESVSDDLMGPSEARRFLGPNLGDTVALQGPVVRVEARLPSSFQYEGHALHYYDGMLGTAEARIRSESFLLRLVPGLKLLLPSRE